MMTEGAAMSRELRTALAIVAAVVLLSTPLIFADAPAAQPTSSYLALVFQLAPSPTPTPLPVKALINGDFEQGNTVGWTSNGSLLIIRNATIARSGEWSAFLGSSSKATRIISQEVTVTAAAPYLVYWSLVYSEEKKCTYDSGYVRSNLIGVVDEVRTFCNAPEGGKYQRRVIDLRRVIGSTDTISFIMDTDSIFLSVWSIDDVSMQAKP